MDKLKVNGIGSFTKFATNGNMALLRSIPWIYGGCIGSHGITFTVRPGETPCLHCLLDHLKLNYATLGEVKLSLNEASSMTIAPVDEENRVFVIKAQQQESLVELTLPRLSCEAVHAWLFHKLKRHKKIRSIATS
jgi:molybdopterin/thiamine biosynthesis adenylyltransferase